MCRLLSSLLIFLLPLLSPLQSLAEESPTVHLEDYSDRVEAERLLKAAKGLSGPRRLLFFSKYFLGRKYRPETKKRVKEQRSSKGKVEAKNEHPLPVESLKTSFEYLDCMTYVEHVLALSATEGLEYEDFLQRLIDVMFHAKGEPLMNHLRNHFTSRWARVNEEKAYLKNLARGHPLAKTREVLLNRVGENRTFFIADRFMIFAEEEIIHYFPKDVILEGKLALKSGDLLAMLARREGLDVLHMGFYVEEKLQAKPMLRHASYSKNRILDQDFEQYLKRNDYFDGLLVFRPQFEPDKAEDYEIKLLSGKGKKKERL